MVTITFEDIPGNRARLSAGKSSHDGIHFFCDKVKLAISCLSGAEDAVCLVWLYNGDDRLIILIDICKNPHSEAGIEPTPA